VINSVNAYHVHDLLSPDNPVTYHVPVYQREYTWSRTEWDELYRDLSEAEDVHFLGTIICQGMKRGNKGQGLASSTWTVSSSTATAPLVGPIKPLR